LTWTSGASGSAGSGRRIEAFFDDHEHLLEFISPRLGAMPRVKVTQVETSLILNVAKFSYGWEIP
jgi:hypothetical protein